MILTLTIGEITGILYDAFYSHKRTFRMTPFDKTYNFFKKPWVIGLTIILIILVYKFLDIPIATYFHQLDLRSNMHLLNIFTYLGQWSFYILLFLMAGLYFRYAHKNALFEARSWYLLSCVIIPNLICIMVKICVSRARPDLLFSSNEFGFYWFKSSDLYWSFPSGHAITSIAVVSGLSVLIPRYFYLLFITASLVVISRVVLYRHYLSDVMTGAYISILVVGFYTQYFRAYWTSRLKLS